MSRDSENRLSYLSGQLGLQAFELLVTNTQIGTQLSHLDTMLLDEPRSISSQRPRLFDLSLFLRTRRLEIL